MLQATMYSLISLYESDTNKIMVLINVGTVKENKMGNKGITMWHFRETDK